MGGSKVARPAEFFGGAAARVGVLWGSADAAQLRGSIAWRVLLLRKALKATRFALV